jgi:sodium transport system ATP-binding protein
LIEVTSLSKLFDKVKAVDDMTFTCEAGKVFGLLGSNGAGKTTTLRMLSTILKPTGGSAQIMGYDLAKESDKVRGVIGVLTGDAGLYNRLTPEEIIRYFGRLYGMADQQINLRMEEFFELLDMNEYRKRRTEGFSKGMKQKVNIVRSIIHDPPVMLFDEPTAGLDVMSARTIIKMVKYCREQGKCIIYSTHIMSEVEKVCDEIAVIHQGRILATGHKDAILKQTGEIDLEDAFVKLVGEK